MKLHTNPERNDLKPSDLLCTTARTYNVFYYASHRNGAPNCAAVSGTVTATVTLLLAATLTVTVL